MASHYRIIRNINASAATIALAPRRTEVADAFADMGEGIVISGDTGRIVAFHERHLAEIRRNAERV